MSATPIADAIYTAAVTETIRKSEQIGLVFAEEAFRRLGPNVKEALFALEVRRAMNEALARFVHLVDLPPGAKLPDGLVDAIRSASGCTFEDHYWHLADAGAGL